MRFLFGFLVGLTLCSLYPTLATDAFTGVKKVFVESGAKDHAITKLQELK